MFRKLGNVGDRLLTRLVPRVDAAAGAQGCTGIYCGCIAGFDAYRLTNNHSCGKCPGRIC